MSSIDEWTTKYYGMEDRQGRFISMPLICDKKDGFAVIQFSGPSKAGSFAGYRNGDGVKTLADARDQQRKFALDKSKCTYHIYALHDARPSRSTKVV